MCTQMHGSSTLRCETTAPLGHTWPSLMMVLLESLPSLAKPDPSAQREGLV